MKSHPELPVPDLLNNTFHTVDGHLSKIADDSGGKLHSGCTAVTAFLRVEDGDGKQSFLSKLTDTPNRSSSPSPTRSSLSSNRDSLAASNTEGTIKKSSSTSRIKNALKSLGHGSSSPRAKSPSTPRSESPDRRASTTSDRATSAPAVTPPPTSRRVLYTANAGDARGVLCRGGKAVRLTYDHKGTDKQEAKRITDAGGFVMSGRVNGVLAVTRSLGDSSMKEFVVGAPYTTETALCDEDEFLVLACDGVSALHF